MNRVTVQRQLSATAVTLLALCSTGMAAAQSTAKEAMIELGRQHATSWDLYQTLKARAGGGQTPGWDEIPDWTGIYSSASGFNFDSDQRPGQPPTAKLTPEYQARLDRKLELIQQGIEYDPLSACNPAGHPRWLTEPFLREFAVTPQQTWLINEMMNEVRRVYTDGRGHPPPEDAYALYLGDSIGFWDEDRLVIHTNQLMAGQYQRMQPHYSGQVETVEIWQKVDEGTLEVDVWVYDPPSLLEPWYAKRRYQKLTDPDQQLRIRYWHCSENQNNDITLTQDGASQFTDFDFTDVDDVEGEAR